MYDDRVCGIGAYVVQLIGTLQLNPAVSDRIFTEDCLLRQSL